MSKMRTEQKRDMAWTIGGYSFILIFFIVLNPGPNDILIFIIVSNVVGLIVSLVKIRTEETSRERFVRKREENGPPGFWRGTLSESGRVFSTFFVGLMVFALLLYLTEGTNLLRTLIDQSLGTIGRMALILVIVQLSERTIFGNSVPTQSSLRLTRSLRSDLASPSMTVYYLDHRFLQFQAKLNMT